MAQLDDNNALLIYRVGPVLCCAPTAPVETIIPPPSLTHPPGTDNSHPGIFKHGNMLVNVVDVRVQFGVAEADRNPAGRIVITHISDRFYGFHIDEVIDVIQLPGVGWGSLAPQLSGGVFTRSLTMSHESYPQQQAKIHLYAEFEKLKDIRSSGILKPYIEQLQQQKQQAEQAAHSDLSSPSRTNSADNKISRSNSATADPVRNDFSNLTEQASVDKTTSSNVDSSATINNTARHDSTSDSHGINHNTNMHQTVNHSVSERKSTRAPAATANPHSRTNVVSHPPVTKTVQPSISSTNKASASSTLIPAKSASAPGEPASENLTAASNRNATQSGKSAEVSRPMSPAASGQTTSDNEVHIPGRADALTSAGTETTLWPVLYFLILFILLLAAAGYYLFKPQQQNSLTTPVVENPISRSALSEESTEQTVQPVAMQPDVAPSEQPVIKPEPETSENEKQYHARIETMADEVTIVLTTPENENAFTDETTTASETDDKLTASQNTLDQPAQPVRNPQPAPATTPDKKPARREIVHLVVKGDTLWHITKRYVHNPYRYPELARLNKIRNPDLIYPGQKVRIIQIFSQASP